MEAGMEKLPERKSGTAPAEDVTGSEDGEDESEAEPEESVAGVSLFEDRDCVCGMVVVIAGCGSDASAAEGAVSVVFCSSENEELNGEDFFHDIVSAKMLCKAEEVKKFGDPNNEAEARRAEPGDEDIRKYCGLEKAEQR